MTASENRPTWEQQAVPNRIEDLTRAVTLALLISCITVSFVALVERLVPSWDGTPYVFLCALTAVEAYYSFRALPASEADRFGSAPARVAELAALFAVVQLWVDWQDGRPPLDGWVPHLDARAGLLFVSLFLIWAVAGDVARTLALLREPHPPGWVPRSGPHAVPPERRVAARFFAGGLLLFVGAGLTQPHIAGVLHIPRSGDTGPVLNVLVYFLIGIVALGQLHFFTLQQRWQFQRVAVGHELRRRWLQYSLALVVLVVILALFLPTSHTAGLLDPWRQAWDEFVILLQGPLTWLVRLLGRTSQPIPNIHLPTPTALPHFRHPPSLTHHAGKAASWGALLQALFFWGVVAAAVGYVLYAYLRRRPRRARTPGKLRLKLAAMLAVAAHLWLTLRRMLSGYSQALADHLPRIRIARGPGSDQPSGLHRLARLGSLSPREQVLQYYLSTLRRADRAGVPRVASQTPHEFENVLAPLIPHAEADVHALTTAFVEARYSRHTIDELRIAPIRTYWQRIRAALSHVSTSAGSDSR
jgi:hypothetical protein